MALLGIQEFAVFSGRLIYEYVQAIRMAKEKAPELSDTILALKSNYKVVGK
jgi:hypothetical protein